ncbi:MAG: hypothetical protein PHE56_04755 [Bacteroidales bacterium]|jgi:hypothetical protein|nr:hypothetical protein [Bacteroidales bacterium]
MKISQTFRRTLSFSAFILIVICILSCGSQEKKETKNADISTEDAISYNEKIVGLHSEVDIAFADLLIALEGQTYEEILIRKETALAAIKDVRTKVNELEDFDGNDEFKNELLKIIDHYESIINTELSEIIAMHQDLSDLPESSMVQYNKIYSQAMNKYDSVFNEFAFYQENFAEKWNFDLQ